MTLIVGIQCSDGVVMASDSAGTLGDDRTRTIGQQEMHKLCVLQNALIFSGTGAVGMSQILMAALDGMWTTSFRGSKTAEQIVNEIGLKIGTVVKPYLETGELARRLTGDASGVLWKTMLAFPCLKRYRLAAFGVGGVPELATEDLPFMAMGCGQAIADPFLAFLKRLLWSGSTPTMAEGRLVAAWTIDHVCKTNPGGVGEPIRLAVGGFSDKGVPSAHPLTDEDMSEHRTCYRAAEQALVHAVKPAEGVETPPAPPPK